jgi:hypothetical protein
MKKILLILLMTTGIGSVWSQTITRSLPPSFFPPPPPELNQSLVQNVGSLQFIAFQNNLFAPLSEKMKKDEEELKAIVISSESDLASKKANDPRLSLLPQSYESSVRGLQFVQPSPLHSK